MPGLHLYYFDPTYVLVLIGALLSIWANIRLNTIFHKYSRVKNCSGLTGAQAADRILRQSGIFDVQIERVKGTLNDHYDPVHKVLRLSDANFYSDSVAAVGVAAHECGHAIQHYKGYTPLKLRALVAPVARLGSYLWIPLIIAGILTGLSSHLLQIGIWVFGLTLVFQLVTLPIEFNASGRALQVLQEYGITQGEEAGQCRKVLGAAALTYVAGAATGILQILRLMLLANAYDRD